jgi:hypothetical protein
MPSNALFPKGHAGGDVNSWGQGTFGGKYRPNGRCKENKNGGNEGMGVGIGVGMGENEGNSSNLGRKPVREDSTRSV